MENENQLHCIIITVKELFCKSVMQRGTVTLRIRFCNYLMGNLYLIHALLICLMPIGYLTYLSFYNPRSPFSSKTAKIKADISLTEFKGICLLFVSTFHDYCFARETRINIFVYEKPFLGMTNIFPHRDCSFDLSCLCLFIVSIVTKVCG